MTSTDNTTPFPAGWTDVFGDGTVLVRITQPVPDQPRTEADAT
ncbi:hypothetical protein ACFWFF_01650 [Streptomyces sp. NPDC060223]